MKDQPVIHNHSMTRARLLGEFQCYRRELKGFLKKKIDNEYDVDDILQELNMKLLTLDKDKVSLISEPRAFFYTAVSNLSVDLYRKNNIRSVNRVEVDPDVMPQHTNTPERIIEGQQKVKILVGTVNELPTRCREVFMLYKFKNFSQKEIAQELGISLNMVEKHIIRAHKALRSVLIQEGLL